MPRLEINGLRFHYQQHGAGPDVVLIHAFTSNMSVWMLTNIIGELSGDYRVTAYDLRGHGASQASPSGYTSSDMVADLFALRDALELGPAYLVGHSYGGVIAMQAAVEAPQWVKGVVLSDTYFPGLRDLEPDMGQTEVWTELRDTLREVGSDIGDRVDFGKLFREVKRWGPEQYAELKNRLGAPGTRWLRQVTQLADTTAGEEMFEESGFTKDRICQVQAPVAALYDEHSPFTATRDFLLRNLADCRTDIVPGAKHLAPLQNAADFVRLVREHLDRMTLGANQRDSDR